MGGPHRRRPRAPADRGPRDRLAPAARADPAPEARRGRARRLQPGRRAARAVRPRSRQRAARVDGDAVSDLRRAARAPARQRSVSAAPARVARQHPGADPGRGGGRGARRRRGGHRAHRRRRGRRQGALRARRRAGDPRRCGRTRRALGQGPSGRACPSGLALVGVPGREDPTDAFVGAAGSLDELAQGARVGTSSLRRGSQLLALRPDLEIARAARQRRHPPGEARRRRLRRDRARDAPGSLGSGAPTRSRSGSALDEMTPAAGQGCAGARGPRRRPADRCRGGRDHRPRRR